MTCVSASDCWAVGYYYDASGVQQTLIEEFTIPVQLVSVVSELSHGSAGPFEINLPLTGARGVECRTSASLGAGNYMLVYTFANTLASVAGANVTSGTGMVSSSSVGTDPHQYIVNLTGVPMPSTLRLP